VRLDEVARVVEHDLDLAVESVNEGLAEATIGEVLDQLVDGTIGEVDAG
jgi:hypothetical protein